MAVRRWCCPTTCCLKVALARPFAKSAARVRFAHDAAPAHKHFTFKDDGLADSDNLSALALIAQEILEDLQAALEQFKLIAGDLGADVPEVAV